MYKISKYTFSVRNSKDELLLYNTLVGKRSLCKMPPAFSDITKLEQMCNCSPKKERLIENLYNRGIIVDSSDDEHRKLYDSFIANVSPTTLHLHINSTEKCNFRCIYCYETYAHGSMTIDVQEKIIEFLRNNIHKFTGLHVSWFGGEPLIAMNCIRNLSREFMKLCRYYRIPYSAGITTNGYLLTPNLFEELLDLNIKNYQITIDAIKDIHDRQRITVRKEKTYDTILDNINYMHSLKRRDFEILIRNNITMEIFERVDEYIDTLQSICQNDPRFTFAFYKVGNWLGKASELVVPQLITELDSLRVVYEKILNSNFSGRINFNMYHPGSGACYAGKRNSFLIRANGDVHKCTVSFEQPETAVGEICEGKLLLNDKYYSNIIDIDNCENFYNCYFAPICMGTPCPNDKKRGCPYSKDYLGISLKILDKNNPLEVINIDS